MRTKQSAGDGEEQCGMHVFFMYVDSVDGTGC